MLSVSFRDDELKRINELMNEYSLNRHSLIKLAVRRFLFPHEKTVPLDGKKLSCAVQSQKETGSSQKQDQDDLFDDEPVENNSQRVLEQKNDDLFP